jgi:hypothetical protein
MSEDLGIDLQNLAVKVHGWSRRSDESGASSDGSSQISFGDRWVLDDRWVVDGRWAISGWWLQDAEALQLHVVWAQRHASRWWLLSLLERRRVIVTAVCSSMGRVTASVGVVLARRIVGASRAVALVRGSGQVTSRRWVQGWRCDLCSCDEALLRVQNLLGSD